IPLPLFEAKDHPFDRRSNSEIITSHWRSFVVEVPPLILKGCHAFDRRLCFRSNVFHQKTATSREHQEDQT
ncbi:MAG: hypothetical protein E6833_20735, partial [Bradyrhizobium sp.]|nr:hypothetical protein [Bradyrhizobium sp.]